MNNINKLQLRKILSNHFIKFSLIPILIVEITLLVLYFSINKYISIQNTDFLLNQAQTNTKELLKKESNIVNDKLSEISQLATILQREHELILSNPDRISLPNEDPQFDFADNNVFYKTNKVGSSLYYSSKTQITPVEKNKAIFTEAMDVSLKNIVDVNPLAVAAYFNSWDNMNRLYPFIDDVSTQYGEHIQMEDYNFYYLADKNHNPQKKAVWTGAYLDPAGLGWMLSCIVPIYNKDFLEGVTGIDITIDSFVKNILNQEFLYDAKLFIVDKDGMIIAMPEEIADVVLEITNILSSSRISQLAEDMETNVSFSAPTVKTITSIDELKNLFISKYEKVIIISTQLIFEDLDINAELFIFTTDNSILYIKEKLNKILDEL